MRLGVIKNAVRVANDSDREEAINRMVVLQQTIDIARDNGTQEADIEYIKAALVELQVAIREYDSSIALLSTIDTHIL